MAEFTKGPWVVGPVDDTVVTHMGADGIRYEIAAIDGDYNDPDTWPIMEANARLIAAAPDMFEALEQIQQQLDYGQIDTANKIALAILAKMGFGRATGA